MLVLFKFMWVFIYVVLEYLNLFDICDDRLDKVIFFGI